MLRHVPQHRLRGGVRRRRLPVADIGRCVSVSGADPDDPRALPRGLPLQRARRGAPPPRHARRHHRRSRRRHA
eukprot:4997651-Prymnesium_polylepis.2